MDFLFYFNALIFGVGLAMDAFSVSLANGLNEPDMSGKKSFAIVSTFGIFQAAMPLMGWVFVHYLLESFTWFSKFIPYIALILLAYIGGKMLFEAIRGQEEEVNTKLDFKGLVIQGIATSIDALSVGFTIANMNFLMASTESLIIGLVTSLICVLGIEVGKKFGTKFSKHASIIGGLILIFIGIEIFVEGVF